MVYGKIYKITNKINGKSYIGQTQRPMRTRFLRHINDSKYDNYYFHRAIQKYGIENFCVEILEDNIPKDKINEREIYWIAHYHTYIKDPDCNGYNMTRGGENLVDAIRKLSDEDVAAIKNILATTNRTIFDIASEFGVSYFAISDINIGKSWNDNSTQYPIRPHIVSDINYDTFLAAIELLKTQMFSQTVIAEWLNIDSTSVISNINNGKYQKFEYPYGISFPINNVKIVSKEKIISNKNSILLLLDYLSGTYSRKELADKYGISESYVKSMISAQNKHHFDGLVFPLKLHTKQNCEVLQSKLNTILKYEKMYEHGVSEQKKIITQ